MRPRFARTRWMRPGMTATEMARGPACCTEPRLGPSVAIKIRASIAACHSVAVCSAFGSFDIGAGVLEGDYPWPALMGLPTEKPRRMGFGGLGTCEVFRRPEIGDGTYFSAVLTVPKVVVRFVPTP
jgi:hypothetical protein